MEEDEFLKFLRYSEELSKLSTDLSGPQNDELTDAYKDMNRLIFHANAVCMQCLIFIRAGITPGTASGFDGVSVTKMRTFMDEYEKFRDTWLLPTKSKE